MLHACLRGEYLYLINSFFFVFVIYYFLPSFITNHHLQNLYVSQMSIRVNKALVFVILGSTRTGRDEGNYYNTYIHFNKPIKYNYIISHAYQNTSILPSVGPLSSLYFNVAKLVFYRTFLLIYTYNIVFENCVTPIISTYIAIIMFLSLYRFVAYISRVVKGSPVPKGNAEILACLYVCRTIYAQTYILLI